FIYLRSVFYSNILCNNVFLNKNLNIKLSNFASLAINNLLPLVCYKTSHKLPSKDILTKTKLFALNSTVYKIITSLKPYKDLPNHKVSAAFFKGRYPNLELISIFRDIIIQC
ncbi:hypothetical protein BCR34DRAFT_479053, partial [Clohesyomyces aquaticus]